MESKYAIYKKAVYLAIPMIIQNTITNAVGLVDNLMVGSLGTESITAVSIGIQLIFVINLMVFGGLSGPGIYAAQYFGHGDNDGVRMVFRLKIWIALFCILLGFFALVLFGDKLVLLYLMGESGSIDRDLTLAQATSYLRIMAYGFIPFCISQVYTTSLREVGDSIRPMVAGIASVVADILFNYLLIFGNFGFPRLGVEGAAIATDISRVVELIVIVGWSSVKKKDYPFLQGAYQTLLIPKKVFIPIIKKGAPIFFNEFLWAGGIAVLTQCYSLRGMEIVAGINISNAICNLTNVSFVFLGTAVGILIGQMLGAEQYKQAKESAIKLMWFTAIVSVALMAILLLIAPVFPKAYNTTDEIRRLAVRIIVITAIFFPIQGFLNAMYFTLRSGGKTVITFIFDSGFSWAVCVPVAFLLCRFTNLPILTIYPIVLGLDLIKLVVGYVLIQKGVWITNLVVEENDGHN